MGEIVEEKPLAPAVETGYFLIVNSIKVVHVPCGHEGVQIIMHYNLAGGGDRLPNYDWVPDISRIGILAHGDHRK
jgi:hypothetical protein